MPRNDANSILAGFGAMQADYSAAKRSGAYKRRRGGLAPMGSGADYHYRNESDLLWMTETARDIDRNDMVMGQLVDRHVDNVLGGGFALNPNTGDKGLDAELKARADEEFSDPCYCDAAGELTFYEQERMVLRETAVAGDIFGLPMTDGTMQLVESHLCRSPSRSKKNIVLGVEMTADRRKRLRYWFGRESIEPGRRNVRLQDLRSVPAYDDLGEANVLHVYRPKRPSQTRGVTAFAPIIDAAGMHDDLQFASLLKAQLSAFFLLVRNRTEHFDPAGQQDPSGAPATDPYGLRRREKLTPGSEINSAKGEVVQPWSPNIPNAEFFPHVKLILTFLGINLGMPLVLVLLDASETNFSGFRGALDQARQGFRTIQKQLVLRWHRPYWRLKLHNWADEDPALAARRESSKPGGPFDLFRHTWHAPGWPYIEPGKDAAAELMRESNMLSSPTKRCHDHGEEWPDLVAEVIRDRRLAIEQALTNADELNKQFKLEGGNAVVWRDLAPLPAPERMAISMQIGDEPAGPGDGPARRKPSNAKPKPTAA